MHNELTRVDIQKMQEEIAYRQTVLRPKLMDEVKRTREFGDLSENAEYKLAKQEKNRNESRIRYLKAMIETAVVIDTASGADEIGLFDRVEIGYDDGEEPETVEVVTTLRENCVEGYISKESPLGRALLGHKVGDRVCVQVSENNSYTVTVRSIEKGTDDTTLPISSY